jgi:dihydroflavonol-4-reductase
VTPRVFVTGGTGVIGRAVVERLVAADRQVTALARSEAAERALAGLGARPVAGDVLDQEALRAGMEGCEVVFHMAGVNALCPSRRDALVRVNVHGARAVAEAAAHADVRRLVHTSSAAALGETAGTVGSEETRHRGWFLSDYERSKFEGERAVFEVGRATGFEVVSVNPSSVQGPGRASGTGKLLLAYLDGRLRVFVDTRFSFVDIADCVEGHLLAEARGRPGERYVLSGATLTSEQALALLRRITGDGRRPRTVPPAIAMTVAALVEGASRVARRTPPVCRQMVRTLLHGHAYDGSKAAEELGLAYTPVDETLRRTAAWAVSEGLVKRRPAAL